MEKELKSNEKRPSENENKQRRQTKNRGKKSIEPKVNNETKKGEKKEVVKVENKRTTSKKVNTNKKEKFEFKKSNLKVMALGGLEEIGKNMTIFEQI